jgi:tetratricopeptide (TPR) repeat protein
MWEDARVMFLMCSQDYNKAFAFFNLGVADFNLGLMDEAEKMLAHVNYMDPNHAETWAYLTLVLLKKQPAKVNSAYQCMNEAFKLGLKSPMLSQHIFYEWV